MAVSSQQFHLALAIIIAIIVSDNEPLSLFAINITLDSIHGQPRGDSVMLCPLRHCVQIID